MLKTRPTKLYCGRHHKRRTGEPRGYPRYSLPMKGITRVEPRIYKPDTDVLLDAGLHIIENKGTETMGRLGVPLLVVLSKTKIFKIACREGCGVKEIVEQAMGSDMEQHGLPSTHWDGTTFDARVLNKNNDVVYLTVTIG